MTEFTNQTALREQVIMADGAVVVQADAQQTGRLITLAGGDNFGWISKATLELLRAAANAPARNTP